jgi:formate dehydrogenase major subunit
MLIKETDYGTPKSKSAVMVTLEIDGQTITVPEGTSIMRAAMELGTQIPKLCATDNMASFGSCRLCLVEIEGRKGTPASCTTWVAEGLRVHTQTDRLSKLRQGVMELYLSDHLLTGDNAMQDMADTVGLAHVRYGFEGDNHVSPVRKDGKANPRFKGKTRATLFLSIRRNALALRARAKKCKHFA